MRRVEHVLLAGLRGALGQVDHTRDGADGRLAVVGGGTVDVGGLGVELDPAVEERDLQVDEALVGRQRHRPDGGGHARVAGFLELEAHVPPGLDLQVVGADDLEVLLALEGVVGLAHDRPVGGRVDAADAGVEDQFAVAGVVVLVRAVAAGELAGLLAGDDVELVHLVRGGVADQEAGAVGGDAHVVGAVALHREPPDDLAGGQVDAHDVGEARSADGEQAAVVGGVHVVGVLGVSLADRGLDGQVEGQLVRRGEDLGHPLVAVGDRVDRPDRLVGAGVDDGCGALPVVADEHDVAQFVDGGLGAPESGTPTSPWAADAVTVTPVAASAVASATTAVRRMGDPSGFTSSQGRTRQGRARLRTSRFTTRLGKHRDTGNVLHPGRSGSGAADIHHVTPFRTPRRLAVEGPGRAPGHGGGR